MLVKALEDIFTFRSTTWFSFEDAHKFLFSFKVCCIKVQVNTVSISVL